MQVQSGVDPPKKVALGERAAMVDGADYIAFQQKDKGAPIEVVYPAEGAPLINSPNAVFKAAPNPNAARLFQNWMCSGEGQQALVDLSSQYVPNTRAKPPPGRRPLADIKFMKDDPATVLTEADEIKAKYTAIFKVSTGRSRVARSRRACAACMQTHLQRFRRRPLSEWTRAARCLTSAGLEQFLSVAVAAAAFAAGCRPLVGVIGGWSRRSHSSLSTSRHHRHRAAEVGGCSQSRWSRRHLRRHLPRPPRPT